MVFLPAARTHIHTYTHTYTHTHIMSDTTPASAATPTDTLANKRKRDDDNGTSSEDNSAKRTCVKRVNVRLKCDDDHYCSFFVKTTTSGTFAPPVVVPLEVCFVMVFLTTRFRGDPVDIPFTCRHWELRTVCAFLNARLGAHEGMPGFKDVTTKLIETIKNHFEGLNATVEVCTVPQLRP